MPDEVDLNESPEGDDKVEEKQPDVKELQRQLEHTQRLLKEESSNRDFWFTKANEKATAPEPQAKAEPADEEDDFDYLDATANNRKQAIDKRIAQQAEKAARKIVADAIKQGEFLTPQQTRDMVEGKVSEVTATERLVADFPELMEKDSVLYAETARQLEIIDRNQGFASLPPVEKARIAAERAHSELFRSGRLKQPDADDRERRVGAQQINTGRGDSRAREGSSELTDSQKYWAEQFGQTEKQYKEGLKLTKIVGGRNGR